MEALQHPYVHVWYDINEVEAVGSLSFLLEFVASQNLLPWDLQVSVGADFKQCGYVSFCHSSLAEFHCNKKLQPITRVVVVGGGGGGSGGGGGGGGGGCGGGGGGEEHF